MGRRYEVAMMEEGLTVMLRQPGGMPIKAWDKFVLAGCGWPERALTKMMHGLASRVEIGYPVIDGEESETRRVWLND